MKELKINVKERPLLVNCSFMVIRRIRACQLHFTLFELIITLKFWKMDNEKIIKYIFNLKTPKPSLNPFLPNVSL